METIKSKFDQILIHKDSKDSNLALRIQDIFPQDQIQFVDQAPELGRRQELSADEVLLSKRRLYVTPHKGQFFKRCPGARPGLSCCNYFVLNWGQQCDMDCSYCYLQSFLNLPRMVLYSNLDQAFLELDQMYKEIGNQKVRIGTGEVVDSLSLENLTQNAKQAALKFRDFPNWTLEFKTKSDQIEGLLEIEATKNIVVSWSINPQSIIESEEHLTASLDRRLQAARSCLDHGYQVAFHIDPMIWHPEWEKNYSELVYELSSRFSANEVNVISVGSLRYQPEQRHLMKERFGHKSWSVRGEMHLSRDGKLRYDQALRQKMYAQVFNGFKASSPDWRVFMCMESPETWLSVTEQSPHKNPKLTELFDPKVIQAHRKFELTT